MYKTKSYGSILMLVTVVVAAMPACSEAGSGLTISVLQDRDEETIGVDLVVAVPVAMDRAEIGTVFLECDVDMATGSVLELWQVPLDATVMPWTVQTERVRSGKMAHWVVDARTGAKARLDITKAVREAIGVAPTLRFVLRSVDGEGDAIPLAFLEDCGPKVRGLTD